MNRLIVTINNITCNLKYPFFVVVFLFVPASVSHANQCTIPTEFELLERDGITTNSVNLTAKKFLKSYISSCPDEERSADLYLLGVMDSTEGKSWCDYRTFKSLSLREFIFEKLKKLDGGRLNERASRVIEDILSQGFPCGRKK